MSGKRRVCALCRKPIYSGAVRLEGRPESMFNEEYIHKGKCPPDHIAEAP